MQRLLLSGVAGLYAHLTAALHYGHGRDARGSRECGCGGNGAAALFLAARDRMPEVPRMHNVLCLEQLAVAEAMLDGSMHG